MVLRQPVLIRLEIQPHPVAAFVDDLRFRCDIQAAGIQKIICTKIEIARQVFRQIVGRSGLEFEQQVCPAGTVGDARKFSRNIRGFHRDFHPGTFQGKSVGPEAQPAQMEQYHQNDHADQGASVQADCIFFKVQLLPVPGGRELPRGEAKTISDHLPVNRELFSFRPQFSGGMTSIRSSSINPDAAGRFVRRNNFKSSLLLG
jgi:hypothetical protein